MIATTTCGSRVSTPAQLPAIASGTRYKFRSNHDYGINTHVHIYLSIIVTQFDRTRRIGTGRWGDILVMGTIFRLITLLINIGQFSDMEVSS